MATNITLSDSERLLCDDGRSPHSDEMPSTLDIASELIMRVQQEAQPPIFTIGYGKRSIGKFILELTRQKIEYLIDVRSVPYSRFSPAFNREMFSLSLDQHGVKYVFMGEVLGGRPRDSTCYVDGRVDYNRCSATTWFKEGIDRLRTAWQKRLRVAIMCSEGRPGDCHRSKLIGQVLAKEGIEVVHIDENSALKTHREVISLLTNGRFDLQFTSRKRYLPK